MRAVDIEREDVSVVEGDQSLLPAGMAVTIARFTGFSLDGRFQIGLNRVPGSMTALSTIGLTAADIGTSLVVAFEDGDVRRPIIVGRVHERRPSAEGGLTADGQRLVIRAEREIELRCGGASIVLTRAGKILIRGNYVLTRSRGANKIKGAFVDIN